MDWKQLLEVRNIPCRVSGRHELVIHCPFCGDADPSEHLSISARGRGWRCLRNPAHHHGRDYKQLLVALLKCSEEYARELLGEEAAALPADDKFSETWRKQLGLTVDKPIKPKFLMLPDAARRLSIRRSITGFRTTPAWNYLYRRGYTETEADWIAETYDLHYAYAGKWAYRLIIPIYDRRNVLMTWTARSILLDEKVRYMTLSSDEAFAPPSSLLLGLPLLWNVHNPCALVITEGPFDALAISALGHKVGVYGTCLFGLQVSDDQSLLLDQLSERFDRTWLLLDRDAQLRVLGMRERLPRSCVLAPPLFEGLKDPGDLPKLGVMGRDYVQAL